MCRSKDVNPITIATAFGINVYSDEFIQWEITHKMPSSKLTLPSIGKKYSFHNVSQQIEIKALCKEVDQCCCINATCNSPYDMHSPAIHHKCARKKIQHPTIFRIFTPFPTLFL